MLNQLPFNDNEFIDYLNNHKDTYYIASNPNCCPLAEFFKSKNYKNITIGYVFARLNDVFYEIDSLLEEYQRNMEAYNNYRSEPITGDKALEIFIKTKNFVNKHNI